MRGSKGLNHVQAVCLPCPSCVPAMSKQLHHCLPSLLKRSLRPGWLLELYCMYSVIIYFFKCWINVYGCAECRTIVIISTTTSRNRKALANHIYIMICLIEDKCWYCTTCGCLFMVHTSAKYHEINMQNQITTDQKLSKIFY